MLRLRNENVCRYDGGSSRSGNAARMCDDLLSTDRFAIENRKRARKLIARFKE